MSYQSKLNEILDAECNNHQMLRSFVVARNIKNIAPPFGTNTLDVLKDSKFVGMMIYQDCNMGGTYWRYISFTEQNIDDDKKVFEVAGWRFPSEIPKLVDWAPNEVIEFGGKKFNSRMIVNSIYVRVLTPVSEL